MGVTDVGGAPRRSTAERSESRDALLDAAQALLLEEGYPAVTARRVAARAGLKPQLVHYYFSSMDELLVSVLRRGAAHSLERLDRARRSERPLHAIWELSRDTAVTEFMIEFLALAHHRKNIANEIAEATDRFRHAQFAAVEEVLQGYGVDSAELPLGALLIAMSGVATVTIQERAIGVTTHHDAALALVDDYLADLEP